MDKYSKGLVLPLEKRGFSWRFETRRQGASKNKQVTCFITDRETGKVVLSAVGATQQDALRKAAALADKAPKPLTDREMAQKLAEAERRAAELEAKLVDQQLAEESKRRGRGKKEDTTPADVPVSEA